MTTREALREVQKDLATAFGEDLAKRIVAGVMNAVRAPEGDLDRQKYAEVVKLLAKDDRVIGMFGEFTVRDKLSRWEKLA